jgi:hypothetical protein
VAVLVGALKELLGMGFAARKDMDIVWPARTFMRQKPRGEKLLPKEARADPSKAGHLLFEGLRLLWILDLRLCPC